MIKQHETITIKRSQINFADYNPRTITTQNKAKLKKNLQEYGLAGGLVWNKQTSNLVSGHQRLSIIDKENKYNPNTKENDYNIQVVCVNIPLEKEKALNIFFNNPHGQGVFDNDKLKVVMGEIKFDETSGFDKRQSMSMFNTAEMLSQEELENISKTIAETTSAFKDMSNKTTTEDDFYLVIVFKNADDKTMFLQSIDLQPDENIYCKSDDFVEAILEANREE